MKSILGKKLLEDLRALDKCNLHGLDSNSFSAGYANGFVRGFYSAMKWFLVTLVIILVVCAFEFYIQGLNVSIFAVFVVAFHAFVFGACRERVLSDVQKKDEPDFKAKAIEALEAQILKDAETNDDDSHRHAYEESIRIIKELKM